jgi:hypothetical protein
MSGPKKETPKAATPKAATPKAAPAEEPASQPEAAPGGASQTAQATAAMSGAVSDVRSKLVAGEQFVLAAALSIVLVSYLIFEFLLDYRILGDFSVLLAVLTVLAIWVHRWGHYDFGPAYRIIIGALGVSLALLAILNLLAWARLGGGSGDFLGFIGRLIYWAGGIAAFYGAWMVFRTREE